MKFLLDTCIWIEWLTDGKLAKQTHTYIKNIDQIITSTIIQLELCRWISREFDIDTAMNVIAIMEESHIVSLDRNLALFAAELAHDHKFAMADAIIYATARHNKATIITSDKHFAELRDAIYLNKDLIH